MAVLSPFCLLLAQAAASIRARDLDEWHAPDAASIATWVNSGAISDAVHDESEVTPEDYLWQTLPGRCCFSGKWDDSKVDQEGKSLWVSVSQCSECSVWGQADASCHNGADSCKECGMDLYCPGTPPPLLGGAKVCTGSSRVGEGCNDVYKMGVCMDKDRDDCMRACQANKKCSAIVYYSQEAKGSCVLCGDTLHMVPTPMETTRIYSRVDAPAPPMPLDQRVRHYITDSLPLPPPPRPMAPRSSPPPPAPLVHLGWNAEQGDGTHFECTFVPHIEFSVDSDLQVTNAHASTRFECCNQCGLSTGCVDFVYQHSTGLCVLLPHASSAKDVLRLPNPNVISGSLSITAVRQEASKHGKCEFKPASSYTGGVLGAAVVPSGGKPIATRQDCCDACLASASCGKLAFQPESHECFLFEAYAEAYSTDGLISGVLADRYQSATGGVGQAMMARSGVGGGASLGGRGGGGSGGVGEGAGVGSDGTPMFGLEAPPLPPTLVGDAKPPPAPPPGASDLTKHVVSAVSMLLFFAMVGGFVVCAMCFFSQDIKRVLLSVLDGARERSKVGYEKASTLAAPIFVVAAGEEHEQGGDDDGNVDDVEGQGGGRVCRSCNSSSNGRKGGNKGGNGKGAGEDGRGTREGGASSSKRSLIVTVVTSAISQTKHVTAGECMESISSLSALMTMLMELFPAVLRDRRREFRRDALLLQCRLSAPGETSGRAGRGGTPGGTPGSGRGLGGGSEHADWMLVTPDSDLALVIGQSLALRLVEKPKPFAEDGYTLAFVEGGGGGASSRRGKKEGRRHHRSSRRKGGGGGGGGEEEEDEEDEEEDAYEARATAAAQAARVALRAAQAAEAEAAARRKAKGRGGTTAGQAQGGSVSAAGVEEEEEEQDGHVEADACLPGRSSSAMAAGLD